MAKLAAVGVIVGSPAMGLRGFTWEIPSLVCCFVTNSASTCRISHASTCGKGNQAAANRRTSRRLALLADKNLLFIVDAQAAHIHGNRQRRVISYHLFQEGVLDSGRLIWRKELKEGVQ